MDTDAPFFMEVPARLGYPQPSEGDRELAGLL